MQFRRKLAAAAATCGVAIAGVAMAAPAQAIQGVPCPTNGVTVHTVINGQGKDWCIAGSVGRLTTNLGGVTYEQTVWNWAEFSNQHEFIQMEPYTGVGNLGGEVNYWVGITNPYWVY